MNVSELFVIVGLIVLAVLFAKEKV